MPPSREVRARQNRQRERIAVAHAERRRLQQRRRIASAIVVAVVVVLGVGIAAVASTRNDSKKVAVSAGTPTTAAATTTPTTAATVKTCVGLKDPLPKGSPAMPVPVGPPPTKLVTRDLKVGSGAVVPLKGKATVNYVGVACSTGKIFDSSYAHNQTFDADLSGGKLIPGWDQGIPGMKAGGVRLLSLPPALAYGEQGSPPTIGPNEPLFFLVEVVKVD